MIDEHKLMLTVSSRLTATERQAVLRLCSDAFSTDYEPFLDAFDSPNHVLAHLNGALVGHALWVTRWLQPAGMVPLETAYVEAVAVEDGLQRQGIGTVVMRHVAEAIQVYELGGLSTGSESFYARLGWRTWRGPLSIRHNDQLIATPDDLLMVLALPRTPPLDLNAPLSAEWRAGELW